MKLFIKERIMNFVEKSWLCCSQNFVWGSSCTTKIEQPCMLELFETIVDDRGVTSGSLNCLEMRFRNPEAWFGAASRTRQRGLSGKGICEVRGQSKQQAKIIYTLEYQIFPWNITNEFVFKFQIPRGRGAGPPVTALSSWEQQSPVQTGIPTVITKDA